MKNPASNRGQSNHAHSDIELLSAYIDDEVTPQEAARVERHLQSCRTCVEELESLRWTVGLLREVPPVPVLRSFAIRQIDIEPERARRRFTLPDWLFNSLQWATVATAVLTILLFSADMLLGLSQPASAPRAVQAPAVEQPAPSEAQPPEAQVKETVLVEKEVAPQLETTAVTKREPAAELASGPSSEISPRAAQTPAPTQAVSKARSQSVTVQAITEAPEEAVPEAESEEKALTQASRGDAQEPAVTEPTPAPASYEPAQRVVPRFQNRLRLAEIGLTGVFLVFLALTLWARRRRAT